MQDQATTVTAVEITGNARMNALPRFFGIGHMTPAEMRVYGYMDMLSPDYNGGSWKYFELSNGGFFMAPDTDKQFAMSCDSNGANATVSAEAAGIVACLFMMSDMSFRTQKEQFATLYHQLRDYAAEHAEAGAIFHLID